jgi:hypothetical protein
MVGNRPYRRLRSVHQHGMRGYLLDLLAERAGLGYTYLEACRLRSAHLYGMLHYLLSLGERAGLGYTYHILRTCDQCHPRRL